MDNDNFILHVHAPSSSGLEPCAVEKCLAGGSANQWSSHAIINGEFISTKNLGMCIYDTALLCYIL